MSTGVNIPRIHNIILGTPTKSFTRLMQSIGRGLRLASDKDKLYVYDIVDVLTINLSNGKTRQNYFMKHWKTRVQTYAEEKYPFKVVSYRLDT